MKKQTYLIGPFSELLTMADMPLKGALKDEQLDVIKQGGLLIEDGYVAAVGDFETLRAEASEDIAVKVIDGNAVCLPSFVDCHTHIAFGGSRPNDFAIRNAGGTYLEIAENGGGIWSTVSHTRACSIDELVALTLQRVQELVKQGITTIEVKSGYGLSIDEEIKSLRAIGLANQKGDVDLVATCLAAHTFPKDYQGTPEDYLGEISAQLFPVLKREKLTNRIDAFIEQSAFSATQITPYFEEAKRMGFDITVHADQFTVSGSEVAVRFGAVSADHLEASTDAEIRLLAQSEVVAVALPAASIGLGVPFTPARKLLDAGAVLAIATDWNPGSAPMGQLLGSASILATFEKLSNAEVLAGITFRAAHALGLQDRGRLTKGMLADFVIYNTDNYQNITYLQGALQPCSVWKNGNNVFTD